MNKLIHNPDVRQLGLNPPQFDPRTVRLASYLDETLPEPKKTTNNSHHVKSWPMLKNDELGDCGPVGLLHGVQLLRAMAGRAWTPTDDDAIAIYEQVAGYNPGDPSTDQGTDLLTMLKMWRKGLTLADGSQSRIEGFAIIDLRNVNHIRLAIELFGFIINGIALPVTAQYQKKWSVTSTSGDGAPGSWGGHCTISPDFTKSSVQNITWGEKLAMTYGFLGTYDQEGYCVVDKDALDKRGKFKGVDLSGLMSDLGAI